jgi:hypothetical protein
MFACIFSSSPFASLCNMLNDSAQALVDYLEEDTANVAGGAI